jgi:MIP family channel proteins
VPGQPPLRQRFLAELIGTFSLVLAGCGSIVVQAQTGALGHLGIALSFGLVVGISIATLGHVSGAHLNPSVTLAFALFRHFPWREVPTYALAQLLGASAGAVALRLLFGPSPGALGVTLPAGGALQSLVLEVLLTAVLMLTITAVATDTRSVGQLAAIAVGGTVALDALWGGPISGASMNPARSFGPALLTGRWEAHWIYWLGPLLGAMIGCGGYQLLRAPRPALAPASGRHPLEG